MLIIYKVRDSQNIYFYCKVLFTSARICSTFLRPCNYLSICYATRKTQLSEEYLFNNAWHKLFNFIQFCGNFDFIPVNKLLARGEIFEEQFCKITSAF